MSSSEHHAARLLGKNPPSRDGLYLVNWDGGQPDTLVWLGRFPRGTTGSDDCPWFWSEDIDGDPECVSVDIADWRRVTWSFP